MMTEDVAAQEGAPTIRCQRCGLMVTNGVDELNGVAGSFFCNECDLAYKASSASKHVKFILAEYIRVQQKISERVNGERKLKTKKGEGKER